MKTLRLCTLDGRNPSTMSRLSKQFALRTDLVDKTADSWEPASMTALHRVEELSDDVPDRYREVHLLADYIERAGARP
jgi:hypothetical protein